MLTQAVGRLFALAEALTDRYITIDKVAKVYTYDGCKANSATFESAAGGNLKLTLDVQGKTETAAAAGTFPAISATLSALQPYIHHQAVLTLDGGATKVNNVQVSISNELVLDRFNNTQTRSELPAGDRIVKLTCDNPFTADEVSLYDLAIAGITGTIQYTNGNRSLLFTFANLKVPSQSPEIAGRTTELPLRLEFTAYQSGATKELVVTNDSTG